MILNPQDQKISTLDCELLGIVHALQIFEVLIIGTPHPVDILTDHKPLLPCFTKKETSAPVSTVLKCNLQNFPI